MGEEAQETVRVAIVQDDADTRLLVRMATDMDPRYELVGEYDSLHRAVTGLLTCPVDVVIVDHLEDDPGSCELLAQLRIAVGRARVVIVDSDDCVPTDLAMAAGADAFLEPTAFTHVAHALQRAAGRLRATA